MEAPKCKTCGEKHWGICADHDARGSLFSRSQDTQGGSGKARKAPGGSAPRKSIAEPERAPGISSEDRPAVRSAAGKGDATSGTASPPPKSKRGRPISDKPKSPRAKYQRELMRKRRSKDA